MAVTVTHTKELIAPDSGVEDKVYGADYVAADSHAVTGLGDAAELDVGTAAGTVAAGDHTHSGLAPTGGTTGQVLKKSSDTNYDYGWADDEEGAGGSEAFPVGSVFIAVVSTDPATLLGYGTWSAFGAGKVLIGIDSGDTDFDTVEETGGAKTKAISAHAGTAVSAHAGTAVADHASHTHSYSEVPNHTHPIASGQGSHSHTYSSQTATTGGVSSYEHGAIDASSTAAESSISTNAATLPAMATDNPTGGVAAGTTAGPSATLTHSVTQPNNHTVTQPNDHTALNVVQPYIVVYMWKRTA